MGMIGSEVYYPNSNYLQLRNAKIAPMTNKIPIFLTFL